MIIFVLKNIFLFLAILINFDQPLFPSSASRFHFKMLLFNRFECNNGIKLSTQIVKVGSTLRMNDLLSWHGKYLAALDCYMWIFDGQLIKAESLLLRKPSLHSQFPMCTSFWKIYELLAPTESVFKLIVFVSWSCDRSIPYLSCIWLLFTCQMPFITSISTFNSRVFRWNSFFSPRKRHGGVCELLHKWIGVARNGIDNCEAATYLQEERCSRFNSIGYRNV